MRNKYRIVRRPMNGKTEKVTRIRRVEYGLSLLQTGQPRTIMILQRATRVRVGRKVVWRELARREGTQGGVQFATAD